MKRKNLLLVLFYLLALAIPSAIFVSAGIRDEINSKLILAGVLGISSYVLFSFQFLLVSRTKLLDKYFGLDKIYRYHMSIAILALILAFLHKTIKEQYFKDSLQTSFGDYAFDIFIAISVFSILLMVNKLFFKIPVVDKLRKLLNRLLKLKYQHKILIHNLTVIGLVVLLVHILMAYSVSSNSILRIILIVYFAVPAILYIYHKLIKPYFISSKKYVVSEVITESPSIVTLRFKPKYGKMLNYLPGQFLYVRLKSSKVPHDEHPFTISSSPSQDSYISVTVKALGDFTSKLTNVKPGDSAYIDGSYGTFSYKLKPAHRKMCFIAGGIGITPFLSMIRHMKATAAKPDTVLLWGAGDQSDIINHTEIEEYGKTNSNFKFVPVLSNDKSYSGETGFIDEIKIKKYIANIDDYDFYLCGPPIMMEIQLANLKKLGVEKQHIHYEKFAI